MVIAANGGTENFQLAELPVPAIGPAQVLVRVLATSVNPIDIKLRKSGDMGYGPGSILGFDVAGKIEKVGAAVTEFHPADDVFYCPAFGPPGSYAEFHAADAAIVAKKPSRLSWVEAASTPVAASTAYQALFDRGRLTLGQSVLIINAAGGVGSWATQLAHGAGAYVIGVCSGANVALARSLGADHVIDRTSEDVIATVKEEFPAGVDLVFDCAGHDWVQRCMEVTRPGGKIVTIVNPSGPLSAGYRKNIALNYCFLNRSRATLESISTLIDRGLVKPIISKVFKLDDIATAHDCLEQGGGFGKIAITVGT